MLLSFRVVCMHWGGYIFSHAQNWDLIASPFAVHLHSHLHRGDTVAHNIISKHDLTYIKAWCTRWCSRGRQGSSILQMVLHNRSTLITYNIQLYLFIYTFVSLVLTFTFLHQDLRYRYKYIYISITGCWYHIVKGQCNYNFIKVILQDNCVLESHILKTVIHDV